MSRQQSLLLRYGSAVVFVALALWIRWLLDPILGDHFPFGLAYLALLLTVWLGGWGPSLLAFLLALVLTNILFIPPRYSLDVVQGEHLIGLLVFTLVGLASIVISVNLRRALERAEQNAREARTQTAALEAEVLKRGQLEEQLRQRADELAETQRRKDEFLAMLAHELRNPLAPVRNGLDVLKQLGLEDTPLERVRLIMERQVQHLIRLVDDLLEVARIGPGRIDVQKKAVSLKQAVRHALETCQPLIDARKHSLEVSLPEERACLDADPQRLEQVLINLLGNAIKYTPEAGKITLEVKLVEEQAEIHVRDNGRGIDPEVLPTIFEPFQRAAKAPAGGLGLGLPLVRRLVELHGGTIRVQSEGIGAGSEFIVNWPLSKETPDTSDSGILAAAHVAAKRRILVVDDNRDAAQSLAMILRLKGHEVRIADNGLKAIEIAQAELFDIAFLDIGMPELDGYEVARRLRQDLNLDQIQLIALTGFGQEQYRERSRAAGFNLHLVKPINVDAIEQLLSLHDVAAGAGRA